MTYLRRLAAGAVLVGLVALPSAPATAAHDRVAAEVARVVVQAPGAESQAAQAVQHLGGVVTLPLPIVSGFAATVPAAAVDELAGSVGVRAVTPDLALQPAKRPKPPSTSVQSVYRAEVGADALAKKRWTGAGVRVALIDTGIDTAVASTGDLKGRVASVDSPTIPPTLLAPDPPDVACVNFSGETTCDDTFGHGTFLAGLIAGSGKASGGRYAGVATGAQIVSVKVGGADGSADVSKVLAGIQWVVSFADRYDIRVLNLSLGTDSTVSPNIDPLNLAVQRAWVEGITVVVSAGNFGAGENATYGTVTKPGDDPFVVTVGSVDDLRTTTISDDRLPAFSSWGPTFHGAAKPDVVAPGARLVSLRAPGSTVDELSGTVDATYRTASGTSMSAAVTSGLAAQLLQARPSWRPDDVKAALLAGARPAASTEQNAVGAGLIHGPSALDATIDPTYRTSVISSGAGSLLGSSGTNLVTLSCESLLSLCGVEDGLTSQGNVWSGTQYALTSWSPQSWYESQWVVGIAGHNWQGHNWQTSTWAGHNWQGHNWQGYYGDPNGGPSYGEPIDGSGSYGVWGG